MNLLILKGFNNYFNRKIKKYSDLQDYINRSAAHYTFTDINFNPNDGVVTEQIIGSENQKEVSGVDPEPLKWETEGSPDYIVCYETVPGTTIVDGVEVETAVDVIRYRWFVLESVRTRNGQYKLALKRDSIADHLTEILYSPCFVEKGYVGTDNPLIFNEEGVSVNQIKKSETMLKDETGVPWIVIYMAQNFPSADMDGMSGTAPNKYLTVTGKQTIDTSQALDYTDLPWANIEYDPDDPLSDPHLGNNITRRIPGAGGICVSPILAGICPSGDNEDKYVYPSRTVLKYFDREGEWSLSTQPSQTYETDIGKLDNGQKVLRSNDVDISGGHYIYKYSPIPAYIGEYRQINNYGDAYDLGYSLYLELKKTANLSTSHNSQANVDAIKNYLNTKKALFEGYDIDESSVSTPGRRDFVGGPQMFTSSEELLSYNNKIVTFDNTNYYRIKITRQGTYKRKDYGMCHFERSYLGVYTATETNNLGQYIIREQDYPTMTIDSPTDILRMSRNTYNSSLETWIDHAWFDVQYVPITTETIRCRIMQPESTDRIHANDVAYDIICLPYGQVNFKIKEGATIYNKTSTAQASIGIARAIAAASGSSIYDMQLLPYCPYRQAAEEYGQQGYIDISGSPNQKLVPGCWFKASRIDSDAEEPANSKAVTFGLWCYSSHGTFDIEYNIEIPAENEIFDWKQFNACKKYRLVSPNYTSVFEFNPLKNKGVSVFNVDFNYRPFNPYIHIAPYFNSDGLYGVDTNDQRGLILSGDFSVGYYSDKWADYQINNANYNAIFNRQLQNIDANQALEREQTRWQYGTNIATEFLGLGGGLRGASAGSAGGPWGALIGGIAGTVGGGAGSIAGAVLDERWLGMAQREARSYAVDSYNLNLGNVKALPYGLAKSDALTENFKFFPFIEEYDCTDTEKWAVRAKILYEGMTVNVLEVVMAYTLLEYERAGIDTGLEEFWFKGRMVRLESLTDDFQVANDIYTEVNKGFYLYKDCVIN